MSKHSELLKLVAENPDLEVLAWVDSEIVADDGYSRQLGELGDACIREYSEQEMYGDYKQFVYKDDTEDFEDFLHCEGLTEEEVAEHIKNLKWKKAIFVNVDLPTTPA